MEFDKLLFVVKDENGNKELKTIEKPVIEYYITKPEYWDGKLRNYIEKDKVVPIKCYYKDLYKSIVNTLNDQQLKNYFSESLQAGSDINRRLQRIHLDYRLHSSDINVQDYYIAQYLKKYPIETNNFGLTKVVYDIEVDIEHITGFPDPEEAEAPVNIMTLVDMHNLKTYTLCLKYDHKTYVDTMNRMEEVKQEIHEKYKEILKGREMEFIIEEWDDELDMIKRFFHLINVEIKPDFVLAWNGNGFDNPYLMNRLVRLGCTPEDVMCPKEFPYKRVNYRKDFRNQDPADNGSEFSATSYSIYLDAMNLYANLRKGMGKEESYSLDYIGEKEVGLRKDEMEEGFKTFHITDYKKFMLYNIQDTIMMAMMEWKNNDVDALYSVAMLTQTRIEKAMKKTICLRNLASKFYLEEGAYISNNRARIREQPEGKIKGAFVADPNNVDNIGIEILGNLSRFLFENCIDFDLSSLYPSIILAFNISPETCYGRAFIDDENGNDITDKYIDDYSSRDYVNFGTKWLGLPSVSDIIASGELEKFAG
jgi:DNA polymerase elongation subunit (family B)